MGNLSWPYGMAGTKRIQHIVDYLKEQGYPISLLLLRQGARKSIPEPEGEHRGVTYKTIGHDIKPKLSAMLKAPRYVRDGLHFLKNKKRSDMNNVVYFYGGPTIESLPFLMYAKSTGYRIVFDIVEELEDFSEQRHLLGRIKAKSLVWLDKRLQNLADGLVVISHYLMERYRKKLSGNIPMLLMPIAAHVGTEQEKVAFGDPVKIVYSGSFGNKDGVDNLIDAFINKRESIPEAQLFLTGKGQNAEKYRQKVEGEEQINFVGYLDDDAFYQFLSDADILCMTRVGSDYANAGFPFKLGEYLATGNPVIASKVGDVPRYLKDREDALLVEPDDVTAISDALEYSVRNPSTVLEMGRNGRNKCRQYFDPTANAAELTRLFNTIFQKDVN